MLLQLPLFYLEHYITDQFIASFQNKTVILIFLPVILLDFTNYTLTAAFIENNNVVLVYEYCIILNNLFRDIICLIKCTILNI